MPRSPLTPLVFLLLVTGSVGAQDLRIEHVALVSADSPQTRPDASVLVERGRITEVAIAPATLSARARAVKTAIDGTGLFLTPGLIDSHVHLGRVPGMTAEHERAQPALASAARKQIPRSYLQFGFTTLVDLVSTPDEMATWQREPLHPDTYFCGGAIRIDGYPMNYAPKPQRYQRAAYMLLDGEPAPAGIDPQQHTPEAVVKRIKADGGRCVKLFFERGFGGVKDLPVLSLDTARAVTRAAHDAGLVVFQHANSTEAQTFALDAGVDVLAHGMWRWTQQGTDLTPELTQLLDRIIKDRRGYQATIQVLYGELDLFNPEFFAEPLLARALPAPLLAWYRTKAGQWFRDSVAPALVPAGTSEDPAERWQAMRAKYDRPLGRSRAVATYLAQHDARFLFGTDTPSGPTYVNVPGWNGLRELQRLASAGLTPAQIFRAATLSNAEALGLSDQVGIVSVGRRANLLLLRADPTQTVDAYNDIVKVILGGRVLDPKALSANQTR
ncbi:MAG: amidohydrolase family protein [Polyangiales bacterium]